MMQYQRNTNLHDSLAYAGDPQDPPRLGYSLEAYEESLHREPGDRARRQMSQVRRYFAVREIESLEQLPSGAQARHEGAVGSFLEWLVS